MSPGWMNVWLVATLMLLLAVVPLPQIVFEGNSAVTTGGQWERGQQKQQLMRVRFDNLLQQAQAQRKLMMAWHKRASLQQARQKSRSASKKGKTQVAVATSR